jgi:serine/threonine protein phosphatase PrpC
LNKQFVLNGRMAAMYTSREAGFTNKYPTQNEDSVGVNMDTGIITVCDGMGGHGYGQIASHQVVKAMMDASALYEGFYIARERLHVLNRALTLQGRQACPDAVFSAVHIQNNDFTAMNLGDAMWYQIRNGKVIARSPMQSHCGSLRDAGQMTEVEMWTSDVRNIVHTHVGGECMPPTHRGQLKLGDVMLLVDDGVAMLESELIRVVSSSEPAEAIGRIAAITAHRNIRGTFKDTENGTLEDLIPPSDNLTVAIYKH